MSNVWNQMRECAATMQAMMEHAGYRYHDSSLDKYDWENHIYHSNLYRRGHVEVVDKTETHGIYILHATVFPHIDDGSPIWGFDTVCGKNKITGAFHDFSITEENHEMYKWFENTVKDITWKKERELPDWAKRIFSPSMVAAGNINEQQELDSIISLGIKTLDYYLNNVGHRTERKDYTKEQNNYCINQKQNPHVYRSMIAMGVPEATINQFVHEVLFPEI